MIRAEGGGEPRYVMLETIREYGLERLEAAEAGAAIRRRHAAWCLELAETLESVVAGPDQENVLANGVRQEALAELSEVVGGARAPQHRLEHELHPSVAYASVPVFAMANAGVRIEGDIGGIIGDQVALDVVLGLVLGKQIGVTLGAWLAVGSGATELPVGVSWPQIYRGRVACRDRVHDVALGGGPGVCRSR